jgi:hypothetical protein
MMRTVKLQQLQIFRRHFLLSVGENQVMRLLRGGDRVIKSPRLIKLGLGNENCHPKMVGTKKAIRKA